MGCDLESGESGTDTQCAPVVVAVAGTGVVRASVIKSAMPDWVLAACGQLQSRVPS